MMQEGAEAFEADRQRKVSRWMLLGTLGGAAAGASIGAATGNTTRGLAMGTGFGMLGGVIAGNLLNRALIVNWDRVQEDQADEIAFKAVLNATYDVREVPTLYVAMEKATLRDARVGLGFLGNRSRIKQRREKAAELIDNAYKAEIETQLQKGFIASSAEHRNLMGELRRDNGIMAYYRDMFEMARTNLADATAIRDNDAAAHYFHGKVLKLIGRTPDEQRLAREAFYKATQADKRRQQFGAHLHLALMMAREQGVDSKQIVNEIDSYVTDYARWHFENATLRAFPPNLDSIYEYMLVYGDAGWRPKPPDLKDLPSYPNVNAMFDGHGYGAPRRPVVPVNAATPAPAAAAAPSGPNIPQLPPVTPRAVVGEAVRPVTEAAAQTIRPTTTPPRPAKKK
jgi:hypothetical protein